MRKINVVLAILFVAVFLFYFYGRSIWHPIYVGAAGGLTISETIKLYETSVKKRLSKNLENAGFNDFPKKLSFLAFKDKRVLQVFASDSNGKWVKIKNYPFTGYSGTLGPKLKQGDGQIPEGIYTIEYLNPNSSYHLSMKVSYPNNFDKKMAKLDKRTRLGGDIFIHGNNLTIGCIPIGNEAIEELFVLAVHAKNRGIDVIITPQDFRKNKTFPDIEDISWEKELYKDIAETLKAYPQ